MIVLTDKLCTGCGACVSICPNECIKLDENLNIKVVIDKKKCVECGLCQKVCPIIKKTYPKAYAAYALDNEIIMQSSSGGMFTILANSILEQNGVVFGAAFDENFEVHHVVIEEKADLDKIRRSKYVKSRIENTFREAEEYLKKGKKVLFTGTGCQIEGLLSYLQQKKTDLSLLYTQDIICHGTVIPMVWRKYLNAKKKEYQSEIKSISFRNKKNGWFIFGLNIEFVNGRTYFCEKDEDIYMKTFLENFSLNECCYDCRFRRLKRQSDITLSDFWSVYRTEPIAFNADGTSIVIVNSIKGEKLLESVKNKIFYKDVSMNDISRNEVMLVTTVKKPVARIRFLKMLNDYSMQAAYERCQKLKICVWGSFNLRCIANRCGQTSFQISNNSIVSIFSAPANKLSISSCENAFRNEMLRLDISKKAISKLKNSAQKSDYLLIDFLEERFGVLDLKNGILLTDSDALKDTGFNTAYYQKTELIDDEYLKMWKKAVTKYIFLLKEIISNKKIILVRMLLSEKCRMVHYILSMMLFIQKIPF